MGSKILVIDNYDSFVFNLVHYLEQIGAECTVMRNDETDLTISQSFDGVLISPGPRTPEEAGITVDLVKYCAQIKKPLLGVCLGHQGIGVAFGARVGRAPELLHGKTSTIEHNNSGVLENIPQSFTATRYHSLAIEDKTISDDIEITGRTTSGIVMSLRHKWLPIHGVQFHPESILTEYGHQILGNWLVICGDKAARKKSESFSPLVSR